MLYKVVLTDGDDAVLLFSTDLKEEAENKFEYYKRVFVKATKEHNIYVELLGVVG